MHSNEYYMSKFVVHANSKNALGYNILRHTEVTSLSITQITNICSNLLIQIYLFIYLLVYKQRLTFQKVNVNCMTR